MQRLVVAATAFLAGMGALVVVGYLLVFSAGSDRAARAVPADAAVYVNVYLQPSSVQQTRLAALLGNLPGFADTSTLDEKLDQLAQRLMAQAKVDYRADLRPWLGNEVAMALQANGTASTPEVLLLVAVKDPDAARTALPHLWASSGITFTSQTYHGHEVMVGDTASYVLLPDLLVIGQTVGQVRAAVDADADAAPSLADSADFRAAMAQVPADHLASAYVDARAVLPAGTNAQSGGYSTAAMALVAEANGLHAAGEAAFDPSKASEAARAAFERASTPSELSGWMPADTKAEATLFGLAQSFTAASEQLKADPSQSESADALEQLRTLAALGLGVNVDRDLLPLFDGEAAVAFGGSTSKPEAVLLLKPSDPDGAVQSIDRLQAALVAHGAAATVERGQVIVTVIDVPNVAKLAFTTEDGVVVVGVDDASVRAAVTAHRDGASLASTDRYKAPFELAGTRAGTEIFIDVGGLIQMAGESVGLDAETRDILNQIGALAMTATAHDDHLEFHAVLTVKDAATN
jgi:hypothetical protein